MLSANFVLLALAASASAVSVTPRADYSAVCQEIIKTVNVASKVAFPGSAQYEADLDHWNDNAAQPSACTVEPATAADVGKVLKIVGKSRTPFSVKSGGHSQNPNFSSSPGVLIVTNQFNGTVYDAKTDTATFGTGQIWEDVYSALIPFNRTVVGGRAPGIGVGGFASGGGYGWQTSEYGLAIDQIVGFELVTPNGDVVQVTEKSNPELFWAHKGTGSNFGIVTKYTFKTIKQSQLWGGIIEIGPEHIDAVMQAFANYDAKVTDPKSAVNFNPVKQVGVDGIFTTLQLYYNGVTPPAGIFDEFLAIPQTSNNVKTRTLLDVVSTLKFPALKRSILDHVPSNRFPLDLVKAYIKEMEDVSASLNGTSVRIVSTVIEGFSRSLQTHGTNVKGFSTPSAWPATRAFATFPNAFWLIYDEAKDDKLTADITKASSNRLRDIGAALGVTDTAMNAKDVTKYTNYAVYTNTNEEIYGSALPKLKALKQKYDASNVMGLAGGFQL